MADMEKTRTNKIIKIPAKKFTIKLMYELFIKYLQTGDNGWKLIRKREWPYGAVLKVPNFKDGEYGYAGIMYDEIIGRGIDGLYKIDKNCSYAKWITKSDTIKKYVAPCMNLNLSAGNYDISNGQITPYSYNGVIDTIRRYSFDFDGAKFIAVDDVENGKYLIEVYTNTAVSGTVRKGTYVSINGIEYALSNTVSVVKKHIVTEDENADEYDEYHLYLYLSKPLATDVKKDSVVQVPSESKKYQNVTRLIPSYSSTSIGIREAEAFYRNANVVWFTMFKQYEENFDWLELMGNTRSNPCAHRLGWGYSSQSYPSWSYSPPVYPGEGCPAIGSAPGYFAQNAAECDYVYVYMTKTKHNASIAINFRDYWDMAQVGFFEPFASAYEYAFPAFAMSSNIGIRPNVELHSYGGDNIYHHFYFDYTQYNRSFGHAMIGQAATFQHTTGGISSLDFLCSQVQAMLPSGKWQSFANYFIASEHFKDNSHFVSGWKEPALITPTQNKYFISTTMTQNQNGPFNPLPYGHELPINNWELSNIDTIIDVANTEKYSLLPFYLGEYSGIQSEPHNMLCAIPAMYYVPRPVTRYGVYKNPANTKDLYLVMPNVWENRKWYLIHNFTYLLRGRQSEETLQSEYDRLENLSKSMNVAMHIGENTDFEEYTGD